MKEIEKENIGELSAQKSKTIILRNSIKYKRQT